MDTMLMIDFFLKGGLFMYPILFFSIIALSIFINKFFSYTLILRSINRPISELKQNWPITLTPIVEGIEKGYDDEALSFIGTEQLRAIETGLSWLELIAAITPLLGLAGTVTGMIKAFQVIATAVNVNPAILAGGIWEALITTAAGLLIAIVVHIGYHFLEKKADSIAFIIEKLIHNMKIEKNNDTTETKKEK